MYYCVYDFDSMKFLSVFTAEAKIGQYSTEWVSNSYDAFPFENPSEARFFSRLVCNKGTVLEYYINDRRSV